jgi:nitric oxide reductase subunit B
MKYETQKVAYAYFVCAMALFAIQVLGGLLAGWIYVSPNFLSELLPFNIIRMIHTNALIVWLLLGFFGAAYFLVPEESEREIYSVKLDGRHVGCRRQLSCRHPWGARIS